jgi:hypothetical protein
MRTYFFILCSVLSATTFAQDLEALKRDTRQKVLPLLPKVSGMMQETVATQGVMAAIPVCKEKAPQLIKEHADQTGWSIRRVSLKARNAERSTPDSWEVRQLADFNIRAAAGEPLETLEHGEVVNDKGVSVYRYIRAIPVGSVCLSCHGATESLAPNLRAELIKNYPHDRATGYAVGQIRGGLTVKRPL